MSEEDLLTEDPIIRDQQYVCLSFLKPSSIEEAKRDKDLTVCGVKVRGSYSSYEEAKKRAEYLQKLDSLHNIYIGEVGKWCPFEDDISKAEDSEYMNKDLNKLMKNYNKQQIEAKEYHEIRKRTMMEEIKKEQDHKKKEISENTDTMVNNLTVELEKDDKEINIQKNEIDENIKKLKELELELELLNKENN